MKYNYYDDLVKVDNLKTKNGIIYEKSYKNLLIYFVRNILKKSIKMISLYFFVNNIKIMKNMTEKIIDI